MLTCIASLQLEVLKISQKRGRQSEGAGEEEWMEKHNGDLRKRGVMEVRGAKEKQFAAVSRQH